MEAHGTTSMLTQPVSPCGKTVNNGQIRSYEIRRRSAEDQPKIGRTCLARAFGTQLITKAGKTGPFEAMYAPSNRTVPRSRA